VSCQLSKLCVLASQQSQKFSLFFSLPNFLLAFLLHCFISSHFAMAATSVNSVSPYSANDTDFSGSSASPEEHPLPSPLDEHDKLKFDQVESNKRSLANKHSRESSYCLEP
jgi:hypothetical protein